VIIETTPSEITPQIQDLCQSICESTPVFVPVYPTTESIRNECFSNVDVYISKNGGQRILGWTIWQKANILIEAEAHAVWESPGGDMIDITPHENEEISILFLPDNKMIDTGECIPNIRKALSASPLVAEFIELYNERDRITVETVGKVYELSFEMYTRMREIDDIFNRKVGRNDPCPCQSGLKYKKCCGRYEI